MKRLWLILALANPLGMLVWYLRQPELGPWENRFALGLVAIVSVLAMGSVYLIWRPLAGRRDWASRLTALNLLIVVWFASIQDRLLIEDCPNCWNSRHIRSFTLLGVELVRDERPWNNPRLVEVVAADLGERCTHRKAVSSVMTSVEGLVFIHGICGMRIADGPWYPPCAREYVRSRAASDPAFAREFRAKVLDEFDQAYWRDLLARMMAACPQDALPEGERGEGPSSDEAEQTGEVTGPMGWGGGAAAFGEGGMLVARARDCPTASAFQRGGSSRPAGRKRRTLAVSWEARGPAGPAHPSDDLTQPDRQGIGPCSTA